MGAVKSAMTEEPAGRCHRCRLPTSGWSICYPCLLILELDRAWRECNPPVVVDGDSVYTLAQRYNCENQTTADPVVPEFAKPLAPLADWLKQADELLKPQYNRSL